MIGDSHYQFMTPDDTYPEDQILVKVTQVSLSSVDVSEDEGGVIIITEKPHVPPRDAEPVTMPPKYRTVPEGDMLRIYAMRTLDNPNMYIRANTRGGLIQHESNLSQGGMCWIDAGSIVRDNVTVSGDAFVCSGSKLSGGGIVSGQSVVSNTRASGLYHITGSAQLGACAIDSGVNSVYIGGTAQLTRCTVASTDVRYGNVQLWGGCIRDADLRGFYDAMSLHTRWGWMSAFRNKSGFLRIRVGCQYHGDFDALRAAAVSNDASHMELAMLEGFLTMATAMSQDWAVAGVDCQDDLDDDDDDDDD